MARARANRAPFPHCRVLGHAWDDHMPSNTRVDLDGWDSALVLRCTRCTTTRIDWLDYAGDVGRRRYDYPDGYKEAPELRPSRAAMRLMLVKR